MNAGLNTTDRVQKGAEPTPVLARERLNNQVADRLEEMASILRGASRCIEGI
jgi:hypothetical protein